MILRLDADFSGMPGGVNAEQLAMATLYQRLVKQANEYLPEYGGAALTLIVGYKDTRDEAAVLIREPWVIAIAAVEGE